MAWWEENVGESAMSPRSRSIVSPGGHSGGFRDDASAVGSQAGGEKRLTVVRHLRKQAQNDAQLLINRIALLRVRRGGCLCITCPWCAHMMNKANLR